VPEEIKRIVKPGKNEVQRGTKERVHNNSNTERRKTLAENTGPMPASVGQQIKLFPEST